MAKADYLRRIVFKVVDPIEDIYQKLMPRVRLCLPKTEGRRALTIINLHNGTYLLEFAFLDDLPSIIFTSRGIAASETEFVRRLLEDYDVDRQVVVMVVGSGFHSVQVLDRDHALSDDERAGVSLPPPYLPEVMRKGMPTGSMSRSIRTLSRVVLG